jgi:hypothetical protein
VVVATFSALRHRELGAGDDFITSRRDRAKGDRPRIRAADLRRARARVARLAAIVDGVDECDGRGTSDRALA